MILLLKFFYQACHQNCFIAIQQTGFLLEIFKKCKNVYGHTVYCVIQHNYKNLEKYNTVCP